ncbi:hypothetical protein [Halalkalibacter krulwichiae]|uniref:Secreted protein n=1 Tax=Halalkalibacter krulwichiae TaxID=199441 RepID=A0A1X9M876_9BACI|nr:hypothetical protein [Halalkalibacter krulwichiae]ARK29639.1 hypothetical protein BkAM31D_07065 [Halalkalibacter krulwichiae]
MQIHKLFLIVVLASVLSACGLDDTKGTNETVIEEEQAPPDETTDYRNIIAELEE